MYDRGQNTATTDSSGAYRFESGYPIGEWTIMEAYNDIYYTTGITYQTDNQPTPTTVKGAGVDISALPIIGLSGRVDWGVHKYATNGGVSGVDPDNGGIVGTVSYGTTRNELDPQYFAAEDWQPGVSGLTVDLFATVPCPGGGVPCSPGSPSYQLAADGSYLHGDLLNTYVTESWERPRGCTARDVDGNPLVHYAANHANYDENVLVPTQDDPNNPGECISSFMQGIQFAPYGTDQGTGEANFGAAVNGNYGFGDACVGGTLDATDPSDPACVGGSFEALTAGDYLVQVEIPDDSTGRPLYKVTAEEDVNIANGDQIIPQVPPPACVGALHTVDIRGFEDDGYPELVGDGNNGLPVGVTVPPTTPVDNPTFIDIGGSPSEGLQTPRCDTKLVSLENGKSIAPIFEVFTDVPVPARMRTVIIDDLRFSADPRSIMYGEKAGLAFAPVGIYDFANKLVYTAETDFNGIYDVLLPSTNIISCPTPTGVCASMYRFVANDPGIPGRLNTNYKPAFATHAAGAEGIPGVSTFADLAPTQVGLTVEIPATGISQAVTCAVNEPTPNSATVTPELLAVSKPYVNGSGTFTIKGYGFGTSPGHVTLDGTIALTTTSWSNTDIAVTVPPGTPVGPHQLGITGANGRHTVNGLTFHVLGAAVVPPRPTVPQLDNFNRADANNLGTNWSQAGTGTGVDIRVSTNQAYVSATNDGGQAIWNAATFGASQAAAYTFVGSTGRFESSLLLKASGGTANSPRDSSVSGTRPRADPIEWSWRRPPTAGAPTPRRERSATSRSTTTTRSLPVSTQRER